MVRNHSVVREFLNWKQHLVVGEDYWVAGQEWERKLEAMPLSLIRELALLDLATTSPNTYRKVERLTKIVKHSYLYWWEQVKVAGPFISVEATSGPSIEQEIIKDLMSFFSEGSEAQILSAYFAPLFPKDSLPFFSGSISELEKWSRSPNLGTELAPLWAELFYAKGEMDEVNDYLIEMWNLSRRMKKFDQMLMLLKYFETVPQSDLMLLRIYLEKTPWPKKSDELTFWDQSWSPEILRQLRPVLQIDHDRMLSGVQYQVLKPHAENVESSVRTFALFKLMEMGANGW